ITRCVGVVTNRKGHMRVAVWLRSHLRDHEPCAFATFVVVAVRLGGPEAELLRVEPSRPRRVRDGQGREHSAILEHRFLHADWLPSISRGAYAAYAALDHVESRRSTLIVTFGLIPASAGRSWVRTSAPRA